MDKQAIKARVAEFHKKHGGECYNDGVFWFYRDGSYRDIDEVGVMVEPPDPRSRHGQLQLASNVLKFYQLRLKKAVQEFDNLNTRLANTLPAEPELELRRLKELQGVVDERKADVEKAQKALDETELGRQRRMMLQGQAEQRQRYEEFQKRRQAIKV